jgi:hypothetical protein
MSDFDVTKGGIYIFADEQVRVCFQKNTPNILNLAGAHIHEAHNDDLGVLGEQLVDLPILNTLFISCSVLLAHYVYF